MADINVKLLQGTEAKMSGNQAPAIKNGQLYFATIDEGTKGYIYLDSNGKRFSFGKYAETAGYATEAGAAENAKRAGSADIAGRLQIPILTNNILTTAVSQPAGTSALYFVGSNAITAVGSPANNSFIKIYKNENNNVLIDCYEALNGNHWINSNPNATSATNGWTGWVDLSVKEAAKHWETPVTFQITDGVNDGVGIAVDGSQSPIKLPLPNIIKATLNGNADSATQAGKLTTARKFTIGDTGKDFNGENPLTWNPSEIGYRHEWQATIHGQVWSRLCYIENHTPAGGMSALLGNSFILNVAATRGSVVYNDTFLIKTHHQGAAATRGKIIKISGSEYSIGYSLRLLTNSNGVCYVEIKDSLNSIANGTSQGVVCRLIPFYTGKITTYTAFTSGATLPSGFEVTQEMTTTSADIQAYVEGSFKGNLDGNATSATTASSSAKVNHTLSTNTKYSLSGTTLTASGASDIVFDTGIYTDTTPGHLVVTGGIDNTGALKQASGHLYLTGAQATSSTDNTTQLVFGTPSDPHIVVSSNRKLLVLNPTTTDMGNQILFYLDQASKIPSGLQVGSAITPITSEQTSLGTDKLQFSNLYLSGNANIGTDANISGSLTVNQKAEIKGNTTIGDAATDTLTVNATATFAPKPTFNNGIFIKKKTGIEMEYTSGGFDVWMYTKGADTYGIRYFEGTPDQMAISASGNNATAAGADLCINGNGDGTITMRGKSILNTSNVSGTANKIAKFTATNTLGDSNINDNGTEITLDKPLYVKGGDSASVGKIALDQAQSGQITNRGSQTLFGFTSNNTTTLTIGHTSYSMVLRGDTTKNPTYNTYVIPHTKNTTGTIGSVSKPVYINAGTISEVTGIETSVGGTGSTLYQENRMIRSNEDADALISTNHYANDTQFAVNSTEIDAELAFYVSGNSKISSELNVVGNVDFDNNLNVDRLITQGGPTSDTSIDAMNKFKTDLFVEGSGAAPNAPSVPGFYLGKSANDGNRHMDIVSGENVSYINFNKATHATDFDFRIHANVSNGLVDFQWGSHSDLTDKRLKVNGLTEITGKLTATGRISVPTVGSSWISGKTTSNASIQVSTTQTASSYHPVLAITTSDSHVWNLGGLGNKVGVYGYYASRTANGTDFSTTWDVSNGLLVHTAEARIEGSLTVSKATDLKGTANNSPALIVGGMAAAAHLELDSDEIQAKANGTTVAALYLNNDGGQVNIGSGGLKVIGDTILGDSAANDTVTVNAKSTFNNTLTVATGGAQITGNSKITGTFEATGASTFGSALGVTGATTLSGALDVAGKATFTGGAKISGRYAGGGDDEGLIIGRASNDYAGVCCGDPSGVRSVFYLLPSSNGNNAAVWRFNNGTSSYDIKHPCKAGTIMLTSDTAGKAVADADGNTITTTYVKKAGDTMTGDLTIKNANPYVGFTDTNASSPVTAYVQVAENGAKIGMGFGWSNSLQIDQSGNVTAVGMINTVAEKHTDNGITGGLNLNNSNIIKVNSIYTADKSDGSSEGIHFYRDASHVDSLWAQDGVLYFTQNRALGGSGTNRRVLHNGSNPGVANVIISSASDDYSKYFKVENTTSGAAVSLMVGSGAANRGVYDSVLDKWIIYSDGAAARTQLKLYGSVWNDYAEFRKAETIEPGRIVVEHESGEMKLSSERLQAGANVTSDTFGFAIGETDECKTPIAVAGRALVYTYEDRNFYPLGAAVCAAPGGTVSLMTREEIREWPDRIIGTVSEIPKYETWGEDNVAINGRIWIKVR